MNKLNVWWILSIIFATEIVLSSSMGEKALAHSSLKSNHKGYCESLFPEAESVDELEIQDQLLKEELQNLSSSLLNELNRILYSEKYSGSRLSKQDTGDKNFFRFIKKMIEDGNIQSLNHRFIFKASNKGKLGDRQFYFYGNNPVPKLSKLLRRLSNPNLIERHLNGSNYFEFEITFAELPILINEITKERDKSINSQFLIVEFIDLENIRNTNESSNQILGGNQISNVKTIYPGNTGNTGRTYFPNHSNQNLHLALIDEKKSTTRLPPALSEKARISENWTLYQEIIQRSLSKIYYIFENLGYFQNYRDPIIKREFGSTIVKNQDDDEHVEGPIWISLSMRPYNRETHQTESIRFPIHLIELSSFYDLKSSDWVGGSFVKQSINEVIFRIIFSILIKRIIAHDRQIFQNLSQFTFNHSSPFIPSALRFENIQNIEIRPGYFSSFNFRESGQVIKNWEVTISGFLHSNGGSLPRLESQKFYFFAQSGSFSSSEISIRVQSDPFP